MAGSIFGFSTFASPAIGRTYLAAEEIAVQVNKEILGVPLFVTALLGGALLSVGAILFGVATTWGMASAKWPYAKSFLTNLEKLLPEVGA